MAFGRGNSHHKGDAMSERLSAEQIVKRMCILVERCDRAIDDELLADIKVIPYKVRARFVRAIEQLRVRIADIDKA